MSENNTKKLIEEMRKRTPKLEKDANEDFYRLLLRKWLSVIGVVFIIMVSLGIILSFFVSISPLSSSNTQDIAKTIIAPSITSYGFFLTSVPVISFFYAQEIKEDQKETIEVYEELKKIVTGEDLKIVNSFSLLFNTILHNLRIDILRYVRTYLITSIIALFSAIYLYVILTFVNAERFIVIDFSLLIIILLGIFPIISIALSTAPTRKVVNGGIEFED